MTKKPNKSQRIAVLERQKRELEAQLVHVYHFARIGLEKTRGQMGGGIVVQMHHLGGREVCPAFMIKDCFSDATVDALKADLVRSFESVTEFRP